MVQATNQSWRKCPDVLWDDKTMTQTAERMYTFLLDLCTSTNNIVQISINKLAKRIRCCRKSIINATKYLIQKGHIQKAEKSYITETNSFIVNMILPPKKGRAVSEEQSASAQPEVREVRQANKPPKKKYGEHGRVRLTDEEYSTLLADLGQETTDKYIQIVDDYSEEHKRCYNNNAETIRKWAEEDKDKPKQKKDSWNGYKPNKKMKFNTHGKTYGDLIEELPEEKRAYYYENLSPHILMEVPTRFTLDEMVMIDSYKACVNLHLVGEPEDKEPESDALPETPPKPQPPSEYEMTDEEIAAILDEWDCKLIYGNSAHPLHNLMPGELINLAQAWRRYKGT